MILGRLRRIAMGGTLAAALVAPSLGQAETPVWDKTLSHVAPSVVTIGIVKTQPSVDTGNPFGSNFFDPFGFFGQQLPQQRSRSWYQPGDMSSKESCPWSSRTISSLWIRHQM